MKKLLLILFIILCLLPFVNFGQLPVKCQYHHVVGKPTFNATEVGCISIDYTNNVVWEYYRNNISVASVNRWRLLVNPKAVAHYLSDTSIVGVDGADATVTIGDINTVTGAPGSSASVVVTDVDADPSVAELEFDFTIPRGNTGAVGGDPTRFPFIVVFPSGGNDTPEIQRAVDSAFVTGQSVHLVGILQMASGVEIPKNIKYIHITGGAELWATNNSAWTYFYSDVPTSVSDAEDVYTNRIMDFSNLKLRGWNSGAGQQQTGFDLMAGENVKFTNIKGFNLKRFIDATFHLKSHFLDLESNACIDGLIIRSGFGRYTGATLENSASNTPTVINFRSVGAGWSNIGLGIYDVSLPLVDGLEIEGGYHNIGYDHNSTSSTSMGVNLSRLHFECASPCGIATVRITSSTMTHVIDQPNHIKPGIFVKVVVLGGGYPTVMIKNSSNQRVLHDDVNPILQSANGVGWKFFNCDQPFVASKMATIFTGATMTNHCADRSSGLSRWCIVSGPM